MPANDTIGSLLVGSPLKAYKVSLDAFKFGKPLEKPAHTSDVPVLGSEALLRTTTVPANTSELAVHLAHPSPGEFVELSPEHSSSVNQIDVPADISTNATNAKSSSPSALNAVKAISPDVNENANAEIIVEINKIRK
jgi:hypothetical protein